MKKIDSFQTNQFLDCLHCNRKCNKISINITERDAIQGVSKLKHRVQSN